MKDKIIFVSGIHGVGKTTLCNTVSQEVGINVYSSSNLIREIKSMPINDKVVNNIDENQDILLESIKINIKEENEYVLDGHFVLLNRDFSFNNVPLDTFKNMNIKYIIILYENVDVILKRLNKRDGSNYTKEFIQEFQSKEIDRGIEVAKILDKPYSIINSSETNKVLMKIKNIITPQ